MSSNIKKGRIAQRVPKKTQEQFKELVEHSELPAAVYLQNLIKGEYQKLQELKNA